MPFTSAPQPCWLILIEGEWVGCGACRSRALGLAGLIWGEEIEQGAVDVPPPVIVRADGLCVLLACSGCGVWWMGEGGGHAVHSVCMVDALKDAGEDGWVGDVCPECFAAELMP